MPLNIHGLLTCFEFLPSNSSIKHNHDESKHYIVQNYTTHQSLVRDVLYDFSPLDGWRFIVLHEPETSVSHEQAALLSQMLHAASDAREAVILFGHSATVSPSLLRIINSADGKSCIVAYVHSAPIANTSSSTAAPEPESNEAVFCHNISIPTTGQCSINLLPPVDAGDAFNKKVNGTFYLNDSVNAGPCKYSSKSSSSNIYNGLIGNGLVGAMFLYPYYPKGLLRNKGGIYIYKVVSYHSDTRTYGCVLPSSTTTSSSSSASSDAPSTQSEEIEHFTFSQVSMMSVGHSSQWYVGKENDKLKDVAVLFTSRMQEKQINSMAIVPPMNVQMIIQTNKRFYPQLSGTMLLKEGCMLRMPEYTQYPMQLTYLDDPRPISPPPFPQTKDWVCCDTCDKWRIVPTKDYNRLLSAGDGSSCMDISDASSNAASSSASSSSSSVPSFAFRCNLVGRHCSEPEDVEQEPINSNKTSSSASSSKNATPNKTASSNKRKRTVKVIDYKRQVELHAKPSDR